ncbi:hypothetical protein [uncultured Imperialibacter sp.]|uniref:hypothetical protein n=1 Tax=uncultured Imperialibacter sp. TaxID=1672639 RepID=UPI0030D9B468|tara:strand:- start:25321 stop:25797 length:477 start_codon:yes stop_codon:yes gene_type:complete
MTLIKTPYRHELITEFLQPDGGCRDIYIMGTDELDWRLLLNGLIASDYKYDFFASGEAAELLIDTAQLFGQEVMYFLKVRIDNIHINCHFFTETQIEFDIDPHDFVAFEQHEDLINFMRFLSNTVGKPCRLTPENMEDVALVLVNPNEQDIWADGKGM